MSPTFAPSLRRLAPVILAVATALAGSPTRAGTTEPPGWDPSTPLPKFITHFVIDPKFIVAISKYRSNAGHPYSDDYEEYDRSLKNYYQPLPQYLFGLNGQNTLPEYAPTNGTVASVTPDGPLSTGEPRGNQVSIVPDGYPSFTVTLFHCDSLASVQAGSHVNAGDLVGYANLREAINIDVAVSAYWNLKPVFVSPGVYPALGQVLSPPGWRLLSPFDVMSDDAFAVFAHYGLTDRNAAIVPLAFRDANPAQFAQWDPANLDPFEAVIFPVAPIIDTQPMSAYVSIGNYALFYVDAAIAGTLPTYQWFKNGVAIPGATSMQYQVAGAQPSDAGYYSVVLTTSGGSTTSYSALLTVQAANDPYSAFPSASRLINLSARAQVSAAGPLTAGFVMDGSGTKQLLLRAVGPTLANFGVPAVLPDPAFSLVPPGGTTALVSGSKWVETPTLDTITASVGAFPLTTASADSSVAASLPIGGYTVIVNPNSPKDSGVALAEIYDADPDPVHSLTRLKNVSTLAYCGPGGTGIIAGFVIAGPTEKEVLIRAVGPGLAQFGVPTPMAQPQLLLTPQGTSVPPIFNANWSNNSQTAILQADFASAGAFSLTVGSADAAMALYLPPGSYTVQVASCDGTPGNVLLEIYDLDPFY